MFKKNLFGTKKETSPSSPQSPQQNGGSKESNNVEDPEYQALVDRLAKHKANLDEYTSVLSEDEEVTK
jgi:hypothetical protein